MRRRRLHPVSRSRLHTLKGKNAVCTLLNVCGSSPVSSKAPLASVACAKAGTRATSIVGAVLVSGGFLMSIFANSVVFLYISMGVIVGE